MNPREDETGIPSEREEGGAPARAPLPTDRYVVVIMAEAEAFEPVATAAKSFGIPCGTCKLRGTVRVGPRVYWCQQCEGFSLVTIHAEEGLRTLPCAPTAAERAERDRRLAVS